MTEQVAGHLLAAFDDAARLLGPVWRGGLAVADAVGLGGFARRHRAPRRDPPDAARLARQLHARLLADAAAELSTTLHSLAIPHFVARGVALLGRPYRLGDRELADIDLYVHPHGRALAVGAARDLGFRELSSPEQSGPPALRAGLMLAREGASDVDSVVLDLHWGVEPLDRLLPRPDRPVPDAFWSGVSRDADGITRPRDAHHAALIVHHLAHHDLLHVRGLLDLALLWDALGPDDGGAVAQAARSLGAARALALVAEVLVRDLGGRPLHGIPPPPAGWRGRMLRSRLALARWLAWAARAGRREHGALTRRRVARRLLLVDRPEAAFFLLRDVAAPPRAHLRWRWPDATTDLEAWWRHVGSVLGKAVGK